MRVTLVTNGKLPVRGYGGTQRQVEWLATALAARGVKVTIVASAGSWHPHCEVRHAKTDSEVVRAIPIETDIVHRHATAGPEVDYPTLNTLHNNVSKNWKENANLCFVSRSHALNHGRSTFVYNGFPVDAYSMSSAKNGRVLYLSGIHRLGKNLNRAVDLAVRYDFPLDIAGGSRWKLLTRSGVRRQGVFFKTLSSRYRFHGIVDGKAKLDLLGSARAFLNPIAFEEPFGMAVVEAMLCGTPVLATPRGAMPELVTPDTGRLFESDDAFPSLLEQTDELDPLRIRESAADRFSIEATAAAYLELYQRILDGETLP